MFHGGAVIEQINPYDIQLRHKDICIKIRFCLVGLLIMLSLFSKTFNVTYPTIVIIVIYTFITCQCNLKFVLRYISTFSGIILVWLSVTIIESSKIWLSELWTFSHYCGVFPLCASYYMLFLVCIELFDDYYANKTFRKRRKIRFTFEKRDATKSITHMAALITILLTLILFIPVIDKPAFMYEMDRFEYRSQYMPELWGQLANSILYLIPLILINWKNGRRRESVFAIGIYTLFLFWTGERFTGFLSILFYISMFIVDYKEKISIKYKLKLRHIIIISIIFILILSVVINQYSRLYSVNAWLHLIERIAQQGQLWWAIYDKYNGTGNHISSIVDELQAVTNPTAMPRNYGIYKIMYLCAPANIVTAKIEKGQNYTESTGASLFYYFGPMMLIVFAVFFAWLLAYLMREYYNSIIENRIVSTVIFARLLMVYRNVYSMSRFHMALSGSTILLLLLLFVFKVTSNRKKNIQSVAKRG